jgi:hypothetical protein
MPGAAYTYQWQADCNCYKQVPTVVGPWFIVDRAEPLGPGLTTIGVTVGEYNMIDAYGCTFGEDKRRVRISAGSVDYRAGTELLYGVATLSIIHGITDDTEVTRRSRSGGSTLGVNATAKSGTGRLRARQRRFTSGRTSWTRWCASNTASSGPTGPWTGVDGRPLASAHRRCDRGASAPASGEIGRSVSSSTSIGDAFGSYLDLGFDNGNHRHAFELGALRHGLIQPPSALGGWWHNVASTTEFLGRSEISGVRAKTSVSGPHAGGDCTYLCLDPSRQDYFDLTFGIRVRVVRSLVVSFGAFKPINEDDGVRARGFSPVGSIEATF